MPVRSPSREAVSNAGIVAEARTVGLADEPASHVFKPHAQFFAGMPGFLVRTSADPFALAPAIGGVAFETLGLNAARDHGNAPTAHLCAVAVDTAITGVEHRGSSLE